MSDTTPWWERPDTQVKQDHLTEGEGDGCSNSTSTTHSCKTAPDENDVMRRKCERITRKFRQCPGRPREELTSEREETVDEVSCGSFETSSSSWTQTYGFSGSSEGSFLPDVALPDLSKVISAFPFPVPFGERRGFENGNFPSSFFGTMATVFRGMYEFAREMEKLERGTEGGDPRTNRIGGDTEGTKNSAREQKPNSEDE